MATLTTSAITRSGVVSNLVAASAGGDSFIPDRDTFLFVVNNHTSSHTVTIVTPGSVSTDVPIANVVVTVANAQLKVIGPFPAEFFADPTDGLADITYSAVTALMIEPYKLRVP